jgi:tape measure domain-containing protein
MAARAPNKLASIIYWKNDLASFNKVKKEARVFKKELEGLYKGIKTTMQNPMDMDKKTPRSNKPVGDDAHIKQYRQLQKEQSKFRDQQRRIIRNFLISNKEIREMDRSEKALLVTKLRQAKSLNELNLLQRRLKANILDTARNEKRRTRELQKQNFLQQRISASAKQMAGSYVSAFAVGGTLTGITRTGQAFEGFESAMMAASGSSERTASNLRFVREEAMRLGGDLKGLTRGFTQLVASNQGQVSDKDLRSIFVGVAEASTALQLSADDTSGAIRALSQMFGKTKVQAEELRQQLGERIPGAVQLMAKAAKDAGLVEGEGADLVGNLEKLMQDGKLYAKDILPAFAKQLRLAAKGGLDKALDSNRIAMNRLIFATQEASNELFKSGFGRGLTELFNQLSTSIRDLIPLFKGLGRIAGSALEIISKGIKLITPPLQFLGTILDKLTDATGEFSYIWNTIFVAGMVKFASLSPALKVVFSTLRLGMLGLLRTVMPVVLALGYVEEMLNALVYKNKIGVYYDPRLDKESNYFDQAMYDASKQAEKTRAADIMKVRDETVKASQPTWMNLPKQPQLQLNISTSVDREGNIKPFVDGRIDTKMEGWIGDSMSGLAGGQ